MRWLSGVRGVAGASAVALALGPLVALPLSAVFDRDATHGLRASAFPAALALWDPVVWIGVWQSLAAALVIALVSFVLGVALGNFVGRWRFWGQGPLVALALMPMIFPPVLGAIGLRLLLDDGWPELSRWNPGAPGWIAWIGLGLSRGVPWVAVATREVMTGIDRSWEEVARREGAPRTRVWWGLIWPLVRPQAAAAAGAVFAVSLLDPTVPWIFGLRRTLAFQIVDCAMGRSPSIPRAAALAILGVGLAMLGRRLLRLRSRTPTEPRETRNLPCASQADWRRAAAIVGALLVWIALAWTPVWRAWGEATQTAALARAAAPPPSSLEVFAGRLDDPEVRELLVVSIELGAVVALIALLVALLVENADARLRWVGRISPLAIGVGALAMPYLLSGAAQGVALRSGMVRVGWLRELATGLDPYAAPGVLLVWAVAAAHLPILLAAIAPCRGKARSQRLEMATTLGANRGRAWRTVIWPLAYPTLARSVLATAILAATNFTPALLLAPTSPGRTAGPGVLLLFNEPGGMGRACALGLAMLGLNLLAWLILEPRVMRQGSAAVLS